MNGKRAKYLRRLIYGDMSLREERKYFRDQNTNAIVLDPKGLRKTYQRAKKALVLASKKEGRKHVRRCSE